MSAAKDPAGTRPVAPLPLKVVAAAGAEVLALEPELEAEELAVEEATGVVKEALEAAEEALLADLVLAELPEEEAVEPVVVVASFSWTENAPEVAKISLIFPMLTNSIV